MAAVDQQVAQHCAGAGNFAAGRGDPVPHLLQRTVGAGDELVAAESDDVISLSRRRLVKFSGGFRPEGVVGVEEQQIFALRGANRFGAGDQGAAVLRKRDHPEPRIGGGALFEQPERLVGGAVVDRDHLQLAQRLPERGIQRFFQRRRRIVNRKNNTDADRMCRHDVRPSV